MTAAGLEALRRWFRTEARAYPWTETTDPYAIWISEIMLQQTVVTAVVAPYTAWMARWPDLASLAEASEEQVLRAWEGLGYPSRARNIHQTARVLVARGETTLPDDEERLLALPGIGAYTSAALLSFAFHRPVLTLDANLKRVFQRLDAEPDWTPTLETRWRSLWPALVGGASREANQAVMQLGQLVCRAKNPACSGCALADECQARERGLADAIPTVRRRAVVEKETAVVFWHRGELWWLARPTEGRFSTLWLAPPLTVPLGAEHRLSGRVHTYTKFRDHLTPYAAPWREPGPPPVPAGWMGRWVTIAEARDLGMVSAYRRIFDEARQPALGDEVAEP
jgi:A/G-specific adenine glycosylase